jgi:hypothetical protein
MLGVIGAIVLAASGGAAIGGPPLLCFPYEIGKAESLPWGNDAFEQKKGYDKSKVVDDTLAVLKTAKSTLVRMETLRRAAVYIGSDVGAATSLLARLSWIAMDAEASGKPSAEAWFDAGFLAATLRQAGADIKWHAGVANGADGYAWIQKAVELSPKDPEMQFGAALVVFEHDSSRFKDHLRKAIAAAEPGSNLAKSIESNWACGHKPIAELAKEFGVQTAEKK